MKCPKCGSPTFTADIDDQKTILCTNDACKWKGAAEIGQCPYGKVVPGGILCDTYEFCEFQAWQLVKDDLCWCTREETLLKRAEAGIPEKASPGKASGDVLAELKSLKAWIQSQAKKDPMFHYTGLIAEIEMRERKVQP